LRIECDFAIEKDASVGEVYVCNSQNLIISQKNEIVEGIDGEHKDDSQDQDVTVFKADDQTVRYFPKDLQKFFPNLKGIVVTKSGVKELNDEDLANFHDLEFTDFSNNELESLDDKNIFSANPKLKR
jgi:hypothetical protein